MYVSERRTEIKLGEKRHRQRERRRRKECISERRTEIKLERRDTDRERDGQEKSV